MSSQNDFMKKIHTDLQGVNLSELMETTGDENTIRAMELLREEFAHLPPPPPPLQAPKSAEYPSYKYNRKERRKIERENKKQGIKTKFY